MAVIMIRVGYLPDLDERGIHVRAGERFVAGRVNAVPRIDWYFVAPWWLSLKDIRQRLYVASLKRKQRSYERRHD